MLEKLINFAVDTIQQIQFDDYDEKEFAIAKVGFLSTRPNSHGLEISEEVLRKCASTVLGKWMVAKMNWLGTDTMSHETDEQIMGAFPKDQEIEFVEDDDGYLRAYATAVISKLYAKKYCDIFEKDNNRAVSVEMKVQSENNEDMNDIVLSFSITAVTTLGKGIAPSCPESDVTMIRFSQEDADAYFNKMNEHNLTPLKKFAKERIENMAEKDNYVNHPIDTSKEALYEGEWDGQKAKQDLVKEKNFKSLAPKVCMKLEEGWGDREVTKLGYPVMMLYDGKWVYSRQGLASALGYAKKENETSVVNKIEKIYKKLNLDDNEGKEEKMSEKVEFNETEQTMASEPEEAKEETADMSETSAEMAEGEKVECDESEKVEGDESGEKAEDAETEEESTKMSDDEMMAKIAELEKSVEERDHIIMDKDTELEELRAYKAAVVAKEMACRVDSVMEEIRTYINDDQFAEFKAEGLSCGENDIDAWSNKVKATCFSEVKKNIKKDDKGVFSFAMPKVIKHSDPNSIWEKLENK